MGRISMKNNMRTPEEKEAIVLEYMNGKAGTREVSAGYGISRSVLIKWIKKYRENGIEGLRSRTGKHSNPNIGKYNRYPSEVALEKFPEVFADSYFRIVDEDELPVTVAAQCNALGGGGFEILIKQSVYDGAYRGVGAYRDHIVHELCHAFLYSIGFTPVMDMSYSEDNYPCFCSSEWQAKALCGEVMMPYEETEFLSKKKIEELYGVSKAQAKFRKKY